MESVAKAASATQSIVRRSSSLKSANSNSSELDMADIEPPERVPDVISFFNRPDAICNKITQDEENRT